MGEVHVFVVRVWQRMRQFRASAREVGAEESRFFTSPEALGDYLRQATEGQPLPPSSPADDKPTS